MSKGEFVSYTMSDGIQCSMIICMTELGDKLYFYLKTVDYAEDIHFSLVKTAVDNTLLMAFRIR